MIEEKVSDFENLIKIDKTFVINNNNYEYQKTLARKNSQQKIMDAINKISDVENKQQEIESKLDLIIKHLGIQ